MNGLDAVDIIESIFRSEFDVPYELSGSLGQRRERKLK